MSLNRNQLKSEHPERYFLGYSEIKFRLDDILVWPFNRPFRKIQTIYLFTCPFTEVSWACIFLEDVLRLQIPDHSHAPKDKSTLE